MGDTARVAEWQGGVAVCEGLGRTELIKTGLIKAIVSVSVVNRLMGFGERLLLVQYALTEDTYLTRPEEACDYYKAW